MSILIKDDIIVLIFVGKISDSSLSEAFFDFSYYPSEIESECLNSFRDKLDRNIARISSNDRDSSRSFDFFDIFREDFCDILEILSSFFFGNISSRVGDRI